MTSDHMTDGCAFFSYKHNLVQILRGIPSLPYDPSRRMPSQTGP
jgi:hypothetical protein